MHKELWLLWLLGMSPFKLQDLGHCDAISHYFKIFGGCHARTFSSYLLSLGRLQQLNTLAIWLTKINCRSCVPGDAACPESHCHCYVTAALLYSLQFLRQQSPGRAISPLHTSGEYPVILWFPEQTRVYFSVCQRCTALQVPTFRDLRDCPSVFSFSSLNKALQFVMGYEERIFLNFLYVCI